MNIAFAIAAIVFGVLGLYSIARTRKAHADNDSKTVSTWSTVQSVLLCLMIVSILGMTLTR